MQNNNLNNLVMEVLLNDVSWPIVAYRRYIITGLYIAQYVLI